MVFLPRLTMLKQDAIIVFTEDTNHPQFKPTSNEWEEILTGRANSKLRTILFYFDQQNWIILLLNIVTLAKDDTVLG